jgi:hypothetical protein
MSFENAPFGFDAETYDSLFMAEKEEDFYPSVMDTNCITHHVFSAVETHEHSKDK